MHNDYRGSGKRNEPHLLYTHRQRHDMQRKQTGGEGKRTQASQKGIEVCIIVRKKYVFHNDLM